MPVEPVVIIGKGGQAPPTYTLLLDSISALADQIPDNSDEQLQVVAGPAQGTILDKAQLLADGKMVINDDMTVQYVSFFQIGRVSPSGIAFVFIAFFVNAIQPSATASFTLSNQNSKINWPYAETLFLPAGTEVTITVSHSSSGANDGGLVGDTPGFDGLAPAFPFIFRLYEVS